MARLSSQLAPLATLLLLSGGCGSQGDDVAPEDGGQSTAPENVAASSKDSEDPRPTIVQREPEGLPYADYREEILALLRRARPGWARIEEAVEKAAQVASSDEERAEVESWRATVAQRSSGEKDYMAAVALVNSRDVTRYEEARSLLRRVPKGTDLYPDAQAYLEWLDADTLVRAAVAAFDLGELKESFAKLNAALEIQVLGPEAKASVHSRRKDWAELARACREGLSHVRAGRTDEARNSFQRVVDRGRSKRAVHRLAQRYLDALDGKGHVPPDLAIFEERLLATVETDFPAHPKLAPTAWDDPQPKPTSKEPEKKEEDDEGGWKTDFEEWGEDDWDDEPKSSEADPSDSWEDDDWGELKEVPSASAPETPPPPALNPPAVIVGTVSKPDGRPVPGADTEIGFASYVTDASGSFRLKVRKGGPLTILISKPGYRPTRIALEALTARETREVRAILTPGGGFKGRFVDGSGNPMKASGTLWHSEPGSSWSSGIELQPSETFFWEAQRVFQADLRFEIPGIEEVTFLGVQAGTHDLVVTLRPVARLTAIFKLPSGEPAQGKVSYVVWHGNDGSGTMLDLEPDGSISFELQPSTPPATRVTLRYPGHESVNIAVSDLARGELREVVVKLKARTSERR